MTPEPGVQQFNLSSINQFYYSISSVCILQCIFIYHIHCNGNNVQLNHVLNEQEMDVIIAQML